MACQVLGPGQSRAFGPRAPRLSGPARRGRLAGRGVQAHPGDRRHRPGHGPAQSLQVQHRMPAVRHRRDGPVGQGAQQLTHHLAGPVDNGLVAASIAVVALGRRQDDDYRQRLGAIGKGDARQPSHRDPAQAAGDGLVATEERTASRVVLRALIRSPARRLSVSSMARTRSQSPHPRRSTSKVSNARAAASWHSGCGGARRSPCHYPAPSCAGPQ